MDAKCRGCASHVCGGGVHCVKGAKILPKWRQKEVELQKSPFGTRRGVVRNVMFSCVSHGFPVPTNRLDGQMLCFLQ